MLKVFVWFLNLENKLKGLKTRYHIGKVKDEKYIYINTSMIENIVFCNSTIASTTQNYLFGLFKFSFILLDELYYENFNRKEKEFIIFHELGHTKKGHFKREIEDTYEEKLKLEHEADMYAVEHTDWDTAYKTLIKIGDVVSEVFGNHETNINDRIDLLENQTKYYKNN